MITSLKVNNKCQSGGMRNRVGFYMIWYVRSCNWGGGLLHLSWIFWIFLIVLESTYEGGIKLSQLLEWAMLGAAVEISLGKKYFQTLFFLNANL